MRKMIPLSLLWLLTVCAWAASPEEVVADYLAKLKAGNFAQAAACIHPEELRMFRRAMTPSIEEALKRGEANAVIFAEPGSPGRLRKLTDLEFAKLYLEYDRKFNPAVDDGRGGPQEKPIGHVTEGEVEQVIVRGDMVMRGRDICYYSVMRVKKHEGKLMMTISGGLKSCMVLWGWTFWKNELRFMS